MNVRDRFFELAAAKQDDPAFRAHVDTLDPPPVTALEGLDLMWHPTARYKALRFVEVAKLDAGVRDLFARPSAPHLAAVFVDPSELSLRTYENIVPLDLVFEGVDPTVKLAARTKLASDTSVYAFRIEPSPGLADALGRLDGLGLYVEPLNQRSRGGKRFIFHSALLADALGVAMRDAMPPSLMGGFSHVNPVFRCNRFEPTDEKFHRHLDTPYFDAARKHVSRYTVLLYLTGGTGEPALDVPGKIALATIGPMTCVVLDQALAHEGAPFREGRKVFLRTELVFEDADIEHDPAIGALFAQAVYWTGESVFAPELAKHADDYYNRVAEAHWTGVAARPDREPFVHKQFAGVSFISNGYDTWFAKSPGLTLQDCAALALLDHFNCKVGDRPFRKACSATVIEGKRDATWIPEFLASHPNSPALGPIDKRVLFPEAEAIDDVCCPFHGYPQFDATRHGEIVDLYQRAQTFARAHLETAPIVLMGQQVTLDPSRFVIEADRIHVTSHQPLAPVNFAACWNSGGAPDNYLDIDTTVDVVQLLVPPILFRETADTYRLSFDFFRNTWMVKSQQARVPIPKIRNLDVEPEELDEGEQRPWIDGVDPALLRGRTSPARTKAWWVEDSALMTDLFSEREDLDEP